MVLDQEKIILYELLREYNEINISRKLGLKPAQIILTDFESKWGEYDHFVRTISISKKLIRDFPWYYVVGVLKHEMAHQFVMEKMLIPNQHVDAHGQEFKKACDIVKVQKPFSDSRIEIISENSNFSFFEEEMKNPLIEKVKKLMSLATSDNHHEAQLAAKKVREMYLKYNLEQIGLEENTFYYHKVLLFGKKRLTLFDKKLISVLTEYYFVKAIVISQFNAVHGNYESALEMIGSYENIQMAEYVFHFLNQTCERLSQQFKKNEMLTANDKASIKLGLIDGFAEALRHQSYEGITLQSESVEQIKKSERKALVQIENQLNNYIRDYYPRLRSMKSSGRRISRENYQKGVEEGKKINLNKPISQSSVGSKRLGFR
ncbi:MAG: SprT-like domain-containing protein [Pseudobdellovibrio sp.]